MSTYAGRCGAMVDHVLFDFNDSNSKFASEADILALLNRGLVDLAQHNCFLKIDTLDLVAGTSDYALVTPFPDIVKVDSVFWSEPKCELVRLQNAAEYRRSLGVYSPYAHRPHYWWYHNGYLTLSPTPATTAAAALAINYFYVPTPMNGLAADVMSEDTPPVLVTAAVSEPEGIPEAMDNVLEEYALWKLFARDRHAPDAPQFSQQHYASYLQLTALLKGISGPTQLRPYR